MILLIYIIKKKLNFNHRKIKFKKKKCNKCLIVNFCILPQN